MLSSSDWRNPFSMNISVTANAVPATEASSRSRFSVRLRQARGILVVPRPASRFRLGCRHHQNSSAGSARQTFSSVKTAETSPTRAVTSSEMAEDPGVIRIGMPASASVAR